VLILIKETFSTKSENVSLILILASTCES